MKFRHPAIGAAGAMAMFLLPALAQAQSLESFYRGTSLKFVIASSAGGGYDTYGRALSGHIARHIPGNPNVIVQNMPGASGLKATTYMYNVAPRDGSVISLTNAQGLFRPLFTKQGVQFDPLKLNFIGTMSKSQNQCLTWRGSPTKSLADAKNRETTVSATSATGAYAAVPAIMNAVLGTKFKVISGYDTSGVSLAVERGEVDGICGMSYATMSASNPDWLNEKKINFLVQFSSEKHPNLPDVPLVLDLITNTDDRRMMSLILAVQDMGRPVIAPPELPADRLKALQDAFDNTIKDPRFQAESDKRRLSIDSLDHVGFAKVMQDAYATPKDIVERAAKYVGNQD